MISSQSDVAMASFDKCKKEMVACFGPIKY